MSDYKKESQFLLLLDYLKSNPGIALSLSYALITMCGMFFSVGFYSQFDINILQFANFSDLMIIGIADPTAILTFLGGVVIAYATDRIMQVTYDSQQKWRDRPKGFKRSVMLFLIYTPKKAATVMMFLIAMFLIYAFLFVSWYAEWKGKRIKTIDSGQVLIVTEDASTSKVRTLLGTTANFVFTYNKEEDVAEIYPVEKVISLKPNPNIDDEKQAASVK
ncbi:hypothetical protein PN836_010920 [Ningiella sp. W23]|uniref:hypothetical protein n=1 Tax=Ningiella sp. W23 TaxID=3023715 RepID=UPI0037570916